MNKENRIKDLNNSCLEIEFEELVDWVMKNAQNEDGKLITVAKVAKWLSRAAAILFLPLFGVLFYLLTNSNFQPDKYTDLAVDSIEEIAPIGPRTVVQLSDGTEVNLNYGSQN